MVSKKLLSAVVISLLLVLIVVGIWRVAVGDDGSSPEPAAQAGGGDGGDPQRSGSGTRSAAARTADDVCERLSHKTDPQQALADLKELRAALEAMAPEEAASWVGDFLASGRDAELPLEFKVGSDGQLVTAPTLRSALLDHLALVNPQAAAKLGREILATPTTADEWALGLRNVARVEGDEASLAFLRQKTEELIRKADWQADPSAGYLNAFDVLVFTRATDSTPLLSELIQRKDREDLAHAGLLTLERLIRAEPVAMLGELANDRPLQQIRPEMVAQQFARADLRDPAQRDLVRDWLLHVERRAHELDIFASTFPNGSQTISNNLLTKQGGIEGADLRDRGLRSLEVVESWLQSPEFQQIQSHLRVMRRKISGLIEQAVGE